MKDRQLETISSLLWVMVFIMVLMAAILDFIKEVFGADVADIITGLFLFVSFAVVAILDRKKRR